MKGCIESLDGRGNQKPSQIVGKIGMNSPRPSQEQKKHEWRNGSIRGRKKGLNTLENLVSVGDSNQDQTLVPVPTITNDGPLVPVGGSNRDQRPLPLPSPALDVGLRTNTFISPGANPDQDKYQKPNAISVLLMSQSIARRRGYFFP
jgi:hypothetical protein